MKKLTSVIAFNTILALFTLMLVPGAGAVGWSERAPLNDPRQEVGTAELGGKVYVVGGIRADASVADTVEVYDPDTDSWSFLAPLPIPLHHPGAASVNGKLYVIGGLRPPAIAMSTVFEYEPTSDLWTTKAAMPTSRGAIGTAVLDGKIYAAGGIPSERENDFAAYDPAADQWTTLPDLPTPRNHLTAASVDGKIYVIGGRSGTIGNVTDAVEAFDPVSETWTPKAPLPTARGALAGAAVGSNIVTFGGEGNPGDPDGVFENVAVYDTIADSWSLLPPMPTPRHGIGAGVIGQLVYIPGGGIVEGLGATGTNEVFDAEGIPSYMSIFCQVAMNQASYGLGDEVVVERFRIANQGDQANGAELKAWYSSPDGTPTSVRNFGATGQFMPQPGADVDIGPLTLFSVSELTQLGNYELGCRIVSPITGEEQTIILDRFEIQ